MAAVPCKYGLQNPVAAVVDMVADGMTEDEILAAYPDLEREYIPEAVHHAAEAMREQVLRSS